MADYTAPLSDAQLGVVRFCAIECELQRSGERSVYAMVQAWAYAKGRAETMVGRVRERRWPKEHDVLILGRLVEPVKNAKGYRQVGVRVGLQVKPDWLLVPREMANLLDAVQDLAPDEWFRQYEEIHPFVDGNGRTGQLLYNWLNGSIGHPEWAPNFWDDPRRLPGQGAPELPTTERAK